MFYNGSQIINKFKEYLNGFRYLFHNFYGIVWSSDTTYTFYFAVKKSKFGV